MAILLERTYRRTLPALAGVILVLISFAMQAVTASNSKKTSAFSLTSAPSFSAEPFVFACEGASPVKYRTKTASCRSSQSAQDVFVQCQIASILQERAYRFISASDDPFQANRIVLEGLERLGLIAYDGRSFCRSDPDVSRQRESEPKCCEESIDFLQTVLQTFQSIDNSGAIKRASDFAACIHSEPSLKEKNARAALAILPSCGMEECVETLVRWDEISSRISIFPYLQFHERKPINRDFEDSRSTCIWSFSSSISAARHKCKPVASFGRIPEKTAGTLHVSAIFDRILGFPLLARFVVLLI